MDRCRPWIAAALEYNNGRHTVDDVTDAIRAGQMHLWPAERGCLVTEIIDFPRKRVLNVFCAGGELEQLKDMRDSVEAFARHAGCQSIMAGGRPGWARVFMGDGDVTKRVLLEKEL